MVTPYYKDPEARRIVKTITSLPVCKSCGLSHWTSKTSGACLACQYFELVQVEKKQLADVIEFLRAKGLCIYCGEYGDEIEHVVPKCTRLPTYTVLACKECNGIASVRLFPSFAEKQAYIITKLKKKYQKIITTPEWTEDELVEMGPGLQGHIRMFSEAAKSLRRRVDWSLWHTYYLYED